MVQIMGRVGALRKLENGNLEAFILLQTDELSRERSITAVYPYEIGGDMLQALNNREWHKFQVGDDLVVLGISNTLPTPD